MSEEVGKARVRSFLLFIVAMFLLLSARLWYLQIVRSEDFELLALGNRIRTVPIRAPRGTIYDRHGEVLATNRLAFTVSAVPSGLPDPTGEVVKLLAELLEMDAAEIEETLRKGGAYPYEPIRIKRDVPIDQVIAVEEHRSRLPGIIVEEEWVRVYPHGELAGHLIGYLGLASPSDLQAGYRPTDLVGKWGIEHAYESYLRGEEGQRRVEVNALSRPVRDLETISPKPGMDVHLTLDAQLQRLVEEALASGLDRIREESEAGLAGAGAAVVLDARTGEILAMASHPGIDPARLTAADRAAYVAALNSDPRGPWLNRAVRAFPPGSTFKVVTGVAALEGGAITPQTVYNATGYHKYNKRDWRIHAGLPPAGPVTIVEALGMSTNDFFWEISLRPETGGVRGIAAWARQFGLGETTGLSLAEPAEMRGLVPTPEWKWEVYGEPWYESETMDIAIGQGFLQATPVQMAQLYAALANRGRLVAPRLVAAVTSPSGEVAAELPEPQERTIEASPRTWDAILSGLRHVTQWSRGTAYQAFLGATYDPVGKTGSAQQAGTAAHGWFVGFAPSTQAEIVVAVFAEYGESGSQVARIAREIMDAYFAMKVEEESGLDAAAGEGD